MQRRPAALAAFLGVLAAALAIEQINEINFEEFTCPQLVASAKELLNYCHLSSVTADEQQVECKFLLKPPETSDIVAAYPINLLNTIVFRLTNPLEDDNKKGVFCASMSRMTLSLQAGEPIDNYTLGDLTPGFVAFLSYFNKETFAEVNFKKHIPTAVINLKEECHDLPRKDLKRDCVKEVWFLREVKRGAFDLHFDNNEFWSFLKRRVIHHLGGELSRLLLSSNGGVVSVLGPFLSQLISPDLRVRELTIKHVPINSVAGPIVFMPTLRVLRLPEDELTNISDQLLTGVPNLEELDMSVNGLQKLPSTLPANLKALNVSYNQLENLTGDLPQQLSNLDVSHNLLQELPQQLPAQLLVLNASHNSLARLPDRLPDSLQLLDASHNKLEALPDVLPNRLREIWAAHNMLTAVNSQLMVPLPHLKVLDISHNAMPLFEDVWLPQDMRLVNVSHNSLRNILLLGPGNVSILDASYNDIQSWQVRAGLLLLEGNHNSPLGLPAEGVGYEALELSQLDLGDSLPLSCDPCSDTSSPALRLRQWLLQHQNDSGVQLKRPWPPLCSDPQPEAGTPLAEAAALDDALGCPGSPRYIAQFAVLLITVLALFVGIGVGCYYRRYEITYMMHLMKMRRQTAAAERRDATNYKYDAFVSYSSADRSWVIGQMLPSMERRGETADEPALRLCLHERDFPLGSFIADNILDSMKNSRATVIVLSQAFVDSQWCRWELELASAKVPHLVLVELQRLQRSTLPRHLRYLMDTRTYLEWPANVRAEAAMWKRLRAALVAPECARGEQQENGGKEAGLEMQQV